MFANTVFSTIYESIARLINPSHKAYTQELERRISLLNNRIDFLESDNFTLHEQKLENKEEINTLNRYLGEWHEEAHNINKEIDELRQENKDLKSVNKLISRELSALDYDELKKENASLKRDFWDLAKIHNQLKNDYDELKKHDDWLNDMLLDGSELVTGIDAPIYEYDTLKAEAI